MILDLDDAADETLAEIFCDGLMDSMQLYASSLQHLGRVAESLEVFETLGQVATRLHGATSVTAVKTHYNVLATRAALEGADAVHDELDDLADVIDEAMGDLSDIRSAIAVFQS